jgi:6-phosphogluconolactonase
METLYIGGYFNNNGIYICEFNNDGTIIKKAETSPLKNPSYLHMYKNKLYSALETDEGAVACFKIESNSMLKDNDIFNTSAQSPCYISSYKNRLYVANYVEGNISVLTLNKFGGVEKVEPFLTEIKSNGSNMHYAKVINGSLYVIDTKNDAIHICNTNGEKLSEIDFPKNSNPRHLVTNKEGNMLYVIMEKENKIYILEKSNERFEIIDKVSTLPANTTILSYGGAIRISKNNKYIYASNRGHDSISVFKIEDLGRKLKLIQNVPCGGEFPRDICLNKAEEWMVVANQNSNNISVLKRNKKDGTLKLVNSNFDVSSPSAVLFN